MKKISSFDDVDLVWAAMKYCEGKHHLNGDFFKSVWDFMVASGNITMKQRKAVIKFIKRHNIDIEAWSSLNEDS